jgi:endonuclease/exonuclease/phosphatase family metal-dependent hydrolase
MRELNTFSKIFIVLFSSAIIILVFCRNHFIFGTVLIVGKWIFVILSIYFTRLSFTRISHKWLKCLLYSSIAILTIELAFSYFQTYDINNSSTEVKLSLMSYNLFFKNQSPNQVIKIIKQNNPDILVVQELTPKWRSYLRNTIKKKYPFQKLKAMNGTHGLGVYSKFPIKHSNYLSSSNRPYAQVCEINILKKNIQIINTHLASPAIAVENPDNFIPLFSKNYQLRVDQFQRINKEKNVKKFDAQIIIGDLNTTKYEPIYRTIRNSWSDLNSTKGSIFNYNFPNTSKVKPIIMLDYIFLRGNISGEEFKVIKGGSSDHLAIKGIVKI